MPIPDFTRLGPQKIFELRQVETQKRERCHGCSYLPPQYPDSCSEPDRRCNHPREFLIGRRNCWGRKGHGGAV